MKLLKFNLIFIPFLAICLGLVGYIARKMLLDDAKQHVVQNARIIMETMLSSRTYTTKQVAPLLQHKNFKLQEAIAEFQKIIDHPGRVANCSLSALAHLQMARAYALSGDKEKARSGYQQFLTLWNDADHDIDVLRQANAEYAKLE